jgi:hypothetical protein
MRTIIVLFILTVLQTETNAQFVSIRKNRFDNEKTKSGSFFSPSKTIKKIKNAISIQTKDSIFAFKDTVYFHKDYYSQTVVTDSLIYMVRGEDTTRNWVLIQGTGNDRSVFHLINTDSNKMYTLIGYPKIFGDFLLCNEIEYENGDGEEIELWEINGCDISLGKTFNPHRSGIYHIYEVYLSGDKIFLSTHTKEYYCIDINKE